jgi:SpoVK/Ycf46/Vps4 family AAA+-type ATPase
MATAEQIKSLLRSHFDNDSERFLTISLQVAAHEARQGHVSLADDIKNMVDKSRRFDRKVIPFQPDINDLVILYEPENKLSELIVTDTMRNRLNRLLREYRQKEKIFKHGLINRRKILLSGPPGTGKTLTASIIAGELHLPLYVILVDKLITKYMGETAAKLRQIFDTIALQGGVYLFDEFDAIGAERGRDNEVGEMRRVLNAFLQFIEHDTSDSFIIAATNNISILDQALFRRFDDVLHYTLPNNEQVLQLLNNRLGLFKGNYTLESLTSITENLSHADICRACDDSIKEAILANNELVSKDLLFASLNDRLEAYGKYQPQ